MATLAVQFKLMIRSKFSKYTALIAGIALAIVFISWGTAGHRTVGLIAENHLTPQAKEVVHRFLKKESMGVVASWADEVVHTLLRPIS